MQVKERFAFELNFCNTLDGTEARASEASASNRRLSLPEKKKRKKDLLVCDLR